MKIVGALIIIGAAIAIGVVIGNYILINHRLVRKASNATSGIE